MWMSPISRTQFVSRTFRMTDEEATGKWLVPAELGDPDEVWERICVAAACGQLPGVKISSPRLDEILGHHLICVYCERSDKETASSVLKTIRGLGVEGHLRYKSCKATVDGRDEYLWSSEELEAVNSAGMAASPA